MGSDDLFKKQRNIRVSNKRELKHKILIICEGEKTEVNYLKEIRVEKRISDKLLHIKKCSLGTNPKKVLECAIKESGYKRGKFENFDEVWIVIDRDEHHDFAQTVLDAKTKNINVAHSNPCFELWLLLHFENQTAHIERQNVISKLSRYMSYTKNMNSAYAITKTKLPFANENAKKLLLKHKTDCERFDVLECNPSTKVYKLVEKIINIQGCEANGNFSHNEFI